MDDFEIIRTAHGIDHRLALLATAVPDDDLKGQILAVQTHWRDLTYALTARLCGVDTGPPPNISKRRGRPRKVEEAPGNGAPAASGNPPGAEDRAGHAETT